MTGRDPLSRRLLRDLDRLVPDAPDRERPPLLIALSGGADSTALLRAAVLWRDEHGARMAAAHYDHGMRAESAEDAAFCRRLCGAFDVPLTVGGPPVDPPANEDAARAVRYAFLESTLDALGSDALCATAHHRDDQAETVLMRLFRGSGPHGLRGIPERRGRFVRPLLNCDAAELRAWLRDLDQPWLDDATNADGSNLRSRLRRGAAPVLREVFGDHAYAAVARFADLLAEDDDALATLAADRLAALRRDDADGPWLPREAWLAEPPAVAKRMLRALVGDPADPSGGLEAKHLDAFLAWARDARPGSVLELPAGLVAACDGDRLAVRSAAISPAADAFTLDTRPATPDELASTAPEPGYDPAADRWRLTVPEGTIRGRVRLRTLEEGDRMTPFGADGRRKLRELAREACVPVTRRDALLVAADDRGPLWLVGLARADRTRLLPGTSGGITLLVEPRT